MSEKIGVGIATCGRKPLFEKLFHSLLNCKDQIDHLSICEDTKEDNPNFDNYIIDVTQDKWKGDGSIFRITTDVNLGVAKVKNVCLRHLLEKGCDHIFLIEDDIYIKDNQVFEKYIEASKKSGIQHFNFSQHGLMNKTRDGKPNPKFSVNYGGDTMISFYPHCVGAFSYYSRECLEKVGLMDERYYNACEHVDHTYEIIKAGMHPQFWNFADIANSWEYLGDEEWSLEKSTISSVPNHGEIMNKADQIFVSKHGLLPTHIPQTPYSDVLTTIKEIKNNYEKSDDSNV